jgi:hypothetical protein
MRSPQDLFYDSTEYDQICKVGEKLLHHSTHYVARGHLAILDNIIHTATAVYNSQGFHSISILITGIFFC